MIGLVMAGGKGDRMCCSDEKLLLKYKQPVILHVIDALKKSNSFSQIIAVTSPHSPKTKKILEQRGIKVYDTPGSGYVIDLNFILKSIDDYVFVTSGDLPLLDEEIIKKIIKQQNNNIWTSYLITKDFLKSLGLKSEYSVIFENIRCIFTGISIINARKISNLELIKENYQILNDKRIAFNLNTKEDYELLNLNKSLGIS